MTALDPRHEAELRKLQIIAAAMVGACFVYLGVAFVLAPQLEISDVPPLVPWVLAGAGLVLLAVASVVKRAILGAGGTRGPGAPGAASAEEESRYTQAIVVAFALREGCAIVGLVATFLTGDVVWAAALTALALIAMATGWPRASELESRATGSVTPR